MSPIELSWTAKNCTFIARRLPLVLLVISRLVVHPTFDVDLLVRNKKNEKSAGLAELRREQEKLLYLCDSIKLSVTREEARVSIFLLFSF